MIEYSIAILATLSFAVTFYITKIVAVSQTTIGSANKGVVSMFDNELDDDQKEAAIRKAGIELILGGFQILWRVLVCLLAAAAPIYIAHWTQFMSADVVIDVLMSWEFIVGASVAIIAIVWLLKPKASDGKSLQGNSYSLPDRLLHMFAFSSPAVQRKVSKLEQRFFSKKLNAVSENSPIFITSLARGGTTALLNALSDVQGLVTYRYRDMPFITAPLLWAKFSGPVKRNVKRQKRAHGDGLEIDLDSPEAFDEIYWKLYWPEKYTKKSIKLWTNDDMNSEAKSAMEQSFRALSALRGASDSRYLSKNNANVARLPLLKSMFPTSKIVIPVRHPLAHAASLLRQHNNFLKQQTEDDFVRRYMKDIGHLEFGLIHSPIGFDGFDVDAYPKESPNYWLSYWIAAFQEVKHHTGNCFLVNQDQLRQDPNRIMADLGQYLGLDIGSTDFSSYFLSRPDKVDASVFDPELVKVAEELYSSLSANP